MRERGTKRINLIIALLFFEIVPVHAQPIYQWTDEKGQTHYSNSPNPAAKPSDLPQLGRENIDERIRTVKEQTPDTCIRHGGIDCSKGADSDGSVVCLDGYRQAIQPFQFECMEARLQAQLSLELDGNIQNIIPRERYMGRKLRGHSVSAFRINVRNLSGVAAVDVEVDVVLGKKQRYRTTGPERIESYGSAEYVLSLSEHKLAPTLAQFEQSEYKVDCTNCSAVMRTQSAQ